MISGATAATYLVGTGQVGSLLRATVTASNSVGKTSAFSNLSSAVIAKLVAPVNLGLPAISGPLSLGQSLQASTGAWTGVPANGFSYQWSRCNPSGTGCASISGATGQSYGVGQADIGLALRVNVIATNASGSTSVTSAAVTIAASPVTFKFSATLRPGQEVRHPTRTTTATAGTFSAKLTGTTLTWTLRFSHLTSRTTVMRLNRGVRGTNGAAFKTLCGQCSSPVRGTLTLTASQRDAMRRGGTYVNVLTTRNPFGEIRGQIIQVG